jgi:hypothetical protein
MTLSKKALLLVNKFKLIEEFGLDQPEEFYSIPYKYIDKMRYKPFEKTHGQVINWRYKGEPDEHGDYDGQWVEPDAHPSIEEIINHWKYSADSIVKNNRAFDLKIPEDWFDDVFIYYVIKAWDINHPPRIVDKCDVWQTRYTQYVNPYLPKVTITGVC